MKMKLILVVLVACILVSSLTVLVSTGTALNKADIVALWLLEEGGGNEITDTINGLTGEFFGNPEWTEGKYGSGLEFHGKSDWIVVEDSDRFGFPGNMDFTLAVWLKTESPPDPDEAALIDKGYPDKSESLPWYLLMYLPNGTIALYVRKEAGTRPWAFGKTVVSDGEWHHIVGMKEDTELSIYIDGNLDGTAECQKADYGVNTDPLYLMRHYDCGIIGAVDEFAIIKKALTEDEIRELMQGAEAALAVGNVDKLITTWSELKSVH